MKQRKRFIGLSLLLAVVTMACGVLFAANVQTAYADVQEGFKVDDGVYDSYTDTDSPNGIEIRKYIESRYATTVELSGVNGYKKMTVRGSDPIVNIVPRQLFERVGTEFYIGKEYGFFIETYETLIGNLHSRVAVFDIKTNDDLYLTKGRYITTIEKIFEAEYALVTLATERLHMQSKQSGFYNELYATSYAEVIRAAEGTDFIVPVPRVTDTGTTFAQSNLFYFTDFAALSSLYNVNHYNPIDGALYDPYQDMGAYFTQLDFAYNGKFIKTGDGAFKEGVGVGLDAASLAWEMVGEFTENAIVTAVKAMPLLGVGTSAHSLLQSMVSLSKTLSDHMESAEKTLTYTPFHTFREAQLENNGFLNKDIQYAVSGLGKEKLYIGTGDSVTMEFTLGGTDASWETRIANVLMMNCVKVSDASVNAALRSCKVYDTVEGRSSVYTSLLKILNAPKQDVPEVQAERENIINVFPSSAPKRLVRANIKGEYTFVADSDVTFKLYGSPDFATANLLAESEVIDAKSTITAYLPKGDYYLQFTESTNTRILQSSFYAYAGYAQTGDNTVTFDNSTHEYVRFQADKNRTYVFTANDPDAEIFLLDENMAPTRGGTSVSADMLQGDKVFLKVQYKNAVSKDMVLRIHTEKQVVFDANGGQALNSVIITDDAGFVLPDCVRTAYDFNGWTLQDDGAVVSAEAIIAVDSSVVRLKAKWSPTQYTVSYEENGGTDVPDAIYTIEQVVVLPTDVKKDGYVFLGWHDNPSLTGEPIQRFGIGEYGNKTFYADFVRKNHNVYLDVNSSYTDGVSATLETTQKEVRYGEHYSLPVPRVKGFDFEGWFIGDTKYTDNSGNSLQPYTQRQDSTLSAKWSRRSFFIKVNVDGTFLWLNNDGLTEKEEPIAFSAGLCPYHWIKSRVPVSEYYKEGHVLDDIVNAAGESACWDIIDDLPADGATLELFARYRKEINFKIIFTDYSEAELPSITAAYNDKITLPAPKKTGYSLVRWIVSDYGKNDCYNGTHLQKGSVFNYANMPDLSVNAQEDGAAIYLTAVFDANVYTVTLKDGEETVGEIEVIYDQYLTGVEDKNPTRTGYTFQGWTNAAGVIVIDKNGNLVDNSGNLKKWDVPQDTTLLAKWDPKSYTMTFKDSATNQSKTLYPTFNTTIQLPAFSRSYYSGVWLIGDKTYPFNSDFLYNVDDDLSATVRWTPNSYRIIYANLNYGEYTAQMPEYTKYWYQYGDLINIQQTVPSFAQNGQSYFEFMGWYADKNLTKMLKQGPTLMHGTISAFAKWEFHNALGFSGKEEHTVTKDGIFSNPYDGIENTLLYSTWFEYKEVGTKGWLKEMGIKYFEMTIDFRIKEKEDGYQHLYLYSGSGSASDKVLWSTTLEHGPGKRDKNYKTYTYTIRINIDDMSENLGICLRYNASGALGDTYYVTATAASSRFY